MKVVDLILTDEQVSNCTPAAFRYYEARYFLEKYRSACAEGSHFEMIAHFDAFLFCLVSLEDLVSGSDKAKLKLEPVFMFFKAARNITTHQSVLGAPNQKKTFPRPLLRTIFLSQSPATPFSFSIVRFREILRHSRNKNDREYAEPYLKDLEGRGEDMQIVLEDVMQEGLDAVKRAISL